MNKISELYPKNKKTKIAIVSSLYFLLLMTVSAIQVCIFPRFKFMGTVADATLCTVVIVSFFSNEKEASIYGFFAGIVIDSMGNTGITLLPLIYFLLAYFLGSAARYNHKKNFSSFLVFAAFGTIVRMVSTIAYTALLATRFHLLDLVNKSVFPEAIATFALALIMYYPIGSICKKIRKKLE